MKRSLFTRRPDPLLLASLGLALLYLVWAAILPHGVFDTVDEGGKVLYIQNTLRTGDPSAPFLYPASDLDPAGQFFPTWWRLERDGQFYTWWQPGFPLLTLPFFALFGWFGLYLLPAIGGGAIAYLSGRILRLSGPVPDRWVVLCALATGLATPVMYYSTNFHEHTLATASLMASVFFALRAYQEKKPNWALLAGLFASLAVFMRTETITILFGVGLVLLIAGWRLGLRFGAAFGLTALPWMGLNYLITGYPLNHHVNDVIGAEQNFKIASLGKLFIPKILFGQAGVGALEVPRSLLILASLAVIAGILLLIPRATRAFASLGFLLAGLTGGWLLFSSEGYRSVHALVTMAPQILFAAYLFAPENLRKKSLFPWMLVAGGLTFSVVYLVEAWTAAGGLQWGPRYMLSFYPLFIVGAFSALPVNLAGRLKFTRLTAYTSLAICILIGFGFGLRGWYTNYSTLSLYRQSAAAFSALSDTPMVSAYCDPPLHIPDLYWQQKFLSTSRSGQAAWDAMVKSGGMTAYTRLDSWDLCSAAPFTEMRAGRKTNPSGLSITKFE